jgi:ATP-binding cassette subfamily B protein
MDTDMLQDNFGAYQKKRTGISPRHYAGLLIHYLRPQSWLVGLLILLLLGGIALQLANPQIIRFFLDTAQSGGSQRALNQAAIVFIVFALLNDFTLLQYNNFVGMHNS